MNIYETFSKEYLCLAISIQVLLSLLLTKEMERINAKYSAKAATVSAAPPPSVLRTNLASIRTGTPQAQFLKTQVCIIGSGPAAHTAAIHSSRADLKPILFEGSMENEIPPGGQLKTTTDVENFPGFSNKITGDKLMTQCREQSLKFGTKIYTEMVTKTDFSTRPFKVFTDSKVVVAETVIIATGATARRLNFPGSGDGRQGGYWNRGISSCAVRDGVRPKFRNKTLAVVGGGDSAMEDANFLSRYGSIVYVINRSNSFKASKIMLDRVLNNPKVEVLENIVVEEAYGDGKWLGGVKLKDVVSGEMGKLEVSGLFYAIGREPATKFLGGQLKLYRGGYVWTKPGTTQTSVDGVFAAGDVQDYKYKRAITAAGTGCMAAIEAMFYLQEIGSQEENRVWISSLESSESSPSTSTSDADSDSKSEASESSTSTSDSDSDSE